MQDYVIRRDRLKILGLVVLLLVCSLFMGTFTQILLSAMNPHRLWDWFLLILFAFSTLSGVVATLVTSYELFFSPSEMLRLTREGFYYSGPEVGLRVCYFSWQDVEWVFYHEVEHRSRHHVAYSRFICVDFVKPEAVWQQSVGKPLKRANQSPNHGDLNIQLRGTDHTDKEIRDLINLMNVYREQASRT